MSKYIKSTFQFYKGLQEWFDPAYEPHFARYRTVPGFVRGRGESGVKITIEGIAKKTVWIVR